MTAIGSVHPALFCDLYELTMAAAYHACGRDGVASFEVFVRSLPPERNFLVAAGVGEVLDALDQWTFDDEAITFLRTVPELPADFLDRLHGLHFTGEIRAIPEGEVVFEDEPLIEITAPLLEAQLLETLLLNTVGTATMQASKAVRVALAAGGRTFVDFSARRDHGTAAAMSAARSAAIGGAAATSLVDAGRRYGLALSGTMAHAYVMSFGDEREAFRSFARTFPNAAVLLLDTWDTVEGARHAVEVAHELAADDITISGVRLDSGDLDVLSRKVRSILDESGLRDVRIFASGDLDEYRIAELVSGGAPIDGFGVGTRMGTSADAPSLGVVYKLVDDEHGPKLKLAEGKATLPGRKQVFRDDGFDVIGLLEEDVAGRPLVEVARKEPIEQIRSRCRAAVDALPADLRALEPVSSRYPVQISPALTALRTRLVKERSR